VDLQRPVVLVDLSHDVDHRPLVDGVEERPHLPLVLFPPVLQGHVPPGVGHPYLEGIAILVLLDGFLEAHREQVVHHPSGLQFVDLYGLAHLSPLLTNSFDHKAIGMPSPKLRGNGDLAQQPLRLLMVGVHALPLPELPVVIGSEAQPVLKVQQLVVKDVTRDEGGDLPAV